MGCDSSVDHIGVCAKDIFRKKALRGLPRPWSSHKDWRGESNLFLFFQSLLDVGSNLFNRCEVRLRLIRFMTGYRRNDDLKVHRKDRHHKIKDIGMHS